MIPPDYPVGTSPGEAHLFDMLRVPDVARNWTVLHALHLPAHVRQVEGEADFVILMPELGVLCLEVKSHLRADYVNGAWYLGGAASPDYRGPFRQAEMAARSVKRKVASAFPTARGVLFWPAVVFTHCVPAVKSAAGEWHPWQLVTANELDREPIDVLLDRIMRRARAHINEAVNARWFDLDSPHPTTSDCEAIRHVLRPDVHFLPASSAIRARRNDEIRRYTDEQLTVIEGLDGVNERALIEGPAGTGKTVLAVEEARRAAALGVRVALTCFNQQLAAHVRRDAELLRIDTVDLSTFHALMQRLTGLRPPRGAGSGYWSSELPDAALAELLESGPRYEMLIVDEAQDLAQPAYLDVMDALIEGGLARGCWRMFGDFERQAIYAADPASAIEPLLERAPQAARFTLRRNCRNTPRVAEYVVRLGGLSPGYSRVLRPDAGPAGTPRTAFYRSESRQQELLAETLAELCASGELEAEDVVILSPRVDSCALALDRSGGPHDLELLPEQRAGASSYGTIAAFKGLEAPAIILTDINEVATPAAQRLFYVGVSRATDHLRVIARDGLQASVAGLITGARP
jgi:hypothetical protein